ncbi:hypothetical protein ABZV29_40495 [Streptomyces sp. NPDC005236]|uniref:hypothetical protein n=1 Tax=Streptomyces sp. NPDC005236 TaxID=3157028 RepID=UPI0033A70DFE
MISTASELASWLAEMSDDREKVFDEWRAGDFGIALLPAGTSWDAVRFPEWKAYRTYVDLLDAAHSIGPVLWDSWYRQVYFLASPGHLDLLRSLDLRVVSLGGWLAAPDPRRQMGRFAWILDSPRRQLTCAEDLYLSAVDANSPTFNDAEHSFVAARHVSPWVSLAVQHELNRIF